MRLASFQPRSENGGIALPVVLVAGGVIAMIIASTLALGSHSLRSTHGRTDWTAAFFHAENAMHWVAQQVSDANPVSASTTFSTADGTLAVDYMPPAIASDSGFKGARVTLVRTNAQLANQYVVTASARVGEKVRTLTALLTKSPNSPIFDYEYFLNNWGWWWGSSITGNGGNRANWDFDFRNNPVVNGAILANGNVTMNQVPVDPFNGGAPFGGLAGTDPLAYAHCGVARTVMPNLRDFTYYQTKALDGVSTNGLWIGTNRIVAGYHANVAKPGLYLEGTAAAPIIISNTVVVPGDVVIKGKITGHGTLYVGGNLYLANDVTYLNGPNFSTPPETMTPAQRDQWATDNRNRDLIAFAVRECILGGDVTSGEWKTACFDATTYGLKNVGSEQTLGRDGILHTGDDNVPYDHEDGSPENAWFDADGDGVVDLNYNYNTQLTMTAARAALIDNYPYDSGSPVAYNQVASNNMGKLDGIFYTNHAAAMRLATGPCIINGVVVSRDEAIVFSNSLTLRYDSRVHSRYNNNPNVFVDLGLPIANMLNLTRFAELAPDHAGL